jgi:hypothetical protein
MIQEPEHGFGLDIVEGEFGHGFALLLCEE